MELNKAKHDNVDRITDLYKNKKNQMEVGVKAPG